MKHITYSISPEVVLVAFMGFIAAVIVADFIKDFITKEDRVIREAKESIKENIERQFVRRSDDKNTYSKLKKQMMTNRIQEILHNNYRTGPNRKNVKRFRLTATNLVVVHYREKSKIKLTREESDKVTKGLI